MLKRDTLDVESAKAELEKDESLKATESALRADSPIPAISAMAKDKPSRKDNKSASRFQKHRESASPDRRKRMCCGNPYHNNRDNCTAKDINVDHVENRTTSPKSACPADQNRTRRPEL